MYTIQIADQDTYDDLHELLDNEIDAIKYALSDDREDADALGALTLQLERLKVLRASFLDAIPEPSYMPIMDKMASNMNDSDSLCDSIQEAYNRGANDLWDKCTDDQLREAFTRISDGFDEDEYPANPTRDQMLKFVKDYGCAFCLTPMWRVPGITIIR